MNKAFYIRIRGKVQGVGFRYSTYQEAQRLGLSGWVRNLSNGDVEVWAEGTVEKLEAFCNWLHRGPRFSRVDSAEKEDKTPGGYTGFAVT